MLISRHRGVVGRCSKVKPDARLWLSLLVSGVRRSPARKTGSDFCICAQRVSPNSLCLVCCCHVAALINSKQDLCLPFLGGQLCSQPEE